MKLIEFDGMEFKIADEALLVRPIRELFEKDKTKKKEEFWKQISYLWFMCDPRSSYMYLVNEQERAKEVKKQEGLGDDWEPSELLKDAMNIYRSQTITTSAILLEGMRKGIDKLSAFLGETSFSEKTVASMTSALKQIPELAKALSDAEHALAKDFATDDKARGTATKAIGEDL
jgi:hypothetical protein